MRLSKDPYKGTRDFYPEDMRVLKHMFGSIRHTVGLYGFEEYDAPLVEPTALYAAKSGQEIVNEQTYSFTDRGGRDLTIRPEMTPSLARMVARKQHELTFPLRWYSIPRLYRYERPQRGRLREHFQLNVDMFGVDSPTAELELISVGSQILTDLGATQEDFVIKVNSRKLVNEIYDYLDLSDNQKYNLSKLIDRMNKITIKEFEEQLGDIISRNKFEKFNRFFRFNDTLNKASLSNIPLTGSLTELSIKTLLHLADELGETEGVKELVVLLGKAVDRGSKNVVFDASLMRGFDYYTGIVFEFFDTHQDNRRALFGGGRYDDLVGMFDSAPVSGCGFGMGDVTLKDFLEVHGLLPELTPEAAILVTALDQVAVPQAESLAAALRAKGQAVILDISDTKPGAKFKFANKKGVETVYIIGENELAEGLVQVKNLTTGEQTSQNLSDLLNN
jgi:histidyl-tRNA synthetase